MFKTLIIDDNLQYVKALLNTTINRFKEIHVTHIATTVKEALDIISTNYIDLIFLDLKLPDSNGIEIINKINFFNNVKTPYIIIISGDIALSNQINKEYNILEKISKLEDDNVLYNKVKRIIHTVTFLNNKENIKKEVNKKLFEMGYNWKYKGTHYILEAILYIYESNNMNLLDNLEKNVYKYISYKNNKSINNIKTNIIKATNHIESSKYFLEKPTPKLVITIILNKLIDD